jgi:hypothetical protein
MSFFKIGQYVQSCKAKDYFFKKVANTTLFDFIWFYIMVLVRVFMSYDIHYFAWNLRCRCILKINGSLLAEDLSCGEWFFC